MRGVSLFFISILALIGCGRFSSAPPLPSLELGSMHKDVRKSIEDALAAANAEPSNAEKALHLGMVLHAHDQFQTAAQCYARAHSLDRKRYDTLYYWGQALGSNGEYAPAAERLRQALALRPDSIPAQLKLAEILRQSGDAARGADLCRRVLAREPDNPTAHFTLGRALTGAAAVEELRTALRLFPRYGAAQFALATEYRRSGKQDLAADLLTNYERDKTLIPPLDDPENTALRALDQSATGLLRRAQQAETAGQLEEAITLEQRAIQMEPSLADAWVNLISLYGRTGRDAEAVDAYRKAIALAPGRADAYYNYAVLCFEHQRITEAKTALLKTIEISPRHAEALHNLGVILEREGKWEQAADLYRRALDVNAIYPLAHFHLGRIYVNQRKYPQAIAEFEKSLEPAGESTPAFMYALAATHGRAGDRRRAAELLLKARDQAAARGQRELVASIDRDYAALGQRP